MPALDELVSIPRMARLLEVDRTRLARRAKEGRFPAKLVGGVYVTTLADVLAAERSGSGQGKRGPRQKPLPARIQRLVDGDDASADQVIPEA